MVLILLFACLPKQAPVQSIQALPTDVVVVANLLESREVRDGPTALYTAMEELLQARNLQPKRVEPLAWTAEFGNRRSPSQRILFLTERAEAGEVVFLVDTTASFYSQMSGRYRWTVAVEAQLRGSKADKNPVSLNFEVPVFLDFDHEREDAAIAAAVPVIQHRLAALLDEWLAGREG
jgi:hypothetical protein